VTDGALLGIKSIGSNAEHVVALDADAMDDGADNSTGLQRFARATRSWSSGFLGGVFNGHGRILARRGQASIASLRHPADTKEASLRREWCRILGTDEESRTQDKQRLQGI